MFERYTEQARRTLFFATYEASIRGSLPIETSHLSLALVRLGNPITHMMAAVSVSLEEWRNATEQHLPAPTGHQPEPHDVPFSSAVKHVLNVAREEADALGHRHIGVEHLLLALIRDGEAAWLVQKGLTLDRARDVVRQLGA